LLVAGALNEDSSDINNPADNSSPNQGAAYVFRNTGTTWIETDYLKPGTDAAEEMYFGASVASDLGSIAVGAFSVGSSSQPGKVYVFSLARSAGWIETGVLMNPSSANDSWFGFSVDMDGDTRIVVGEPKEDTNGDDSGAVHVFE
jgi:hypothetical protein